MSQSWDTRQPDPVSNTEPDPEVNPTRRKRKSGEKLPTQNDGSSELSTAAHARPEWQYNFNLTSTADINWRNCQPGEALNSSSRRADQVVPGKPHQPNRQPESLPVTAVRPEMTQVSGCSETLVDRGYLMLEARSKVPTEGAKPEAASNQHKRLRASQMAEAVQVQPLASGQQTASDPASFAKMPPLFMKKMSVLLRSDAPVLLKAGPKLPGPKLSLGRYEAPLEPKPEAASNQHKRLRASQMAEAVQVQPLASGQQTASDPASFAKMPPLFMKKMSVLLRSDAPVLLKAGPELSLGRSKAPLEPEPDLQTAPEQSLGLATGSAEDSQVPNLEDWMGSREAFGSFYLKLRFDARLGLSNSDRILHYILRQNVKIRVLDVVFIETGDKAGKLEMTWW